MLKEESELKKEIRLESLDYEDPEMTLLEINKDHQEKKQDSSKEVKKDFRQG